MKIQSKEGFKTTRIGSTLSKIGKKKWARLGDKYTTNCVKWQKKRKEKTRTLNKAAAAQWSWALWWWTNNDQEVRDGISTRWKNLRTNFVRTKEQKLGPISGTTVVLRYPVVLSPGAFASPGFPIFSSWLPDFLLSFVMSVELLRIRGFCD